MKNKKQLPGLGLRETNMAGNVKTFHPYNPGWNEWLNLVEWRVAP
jgi:hypothetical protein